jgi:hypothetical protein
VTE